MREQVLPHQQGVQHVDQGECEAALPVLALAAVRQQVILRRSPRQTSIRGPVCEVLQNRNSQSVTGIPYHWEGVLYVVAVAMVKHLPCLMPTKPHRTLQRRSCQRQHANSWIGPIFPAPCPHARRSPQLL